MADGEVVLYEDQEYNHTGHKFVVPPITVEDGDDEVTITSDSTQTVGVVVRGTDGSLMYVGVVNASKMGTSIRQVHHRHLHRRPPSKGNVLSLNNRGKRKIL